MRWLVRIAILTLLVGGAYVGITRYGLLSRWKSEVRYRLAKVTVGDIESVVNSTGTVKPVRSVPVGSFVSGPIAEIMVDFNSEVKKGDLLAKIDPRLLSAAVDRDRATLATQQADLARIEALLQQAINNEERARKLLEANQDYLSDTEMDQFHFQRLSLEAQKRVAEAGISQAEASLKNSVANFGYTEIRAPVDGIILEKKVDTGQTVASTFQTPELFVVAPDMEKQMHIFASVDEADIGLIRNAQERDEPVKFTVDAYPDEVFTGKIYQIRKNSTTTQNVVTYPVVIESPNPDLKLLPGMTATISFRIEVKEKVVRVPVAAMRYFPLPANIHPDDRHHVDGTKPTIPQGDLRLSADEKADLAKKRQRRLVWKPGDGGLRAVPIVVGLSDNQYAELVEGTLKDGDELAIGIDSSAAGSR